MQFQDLDGEGGNPPVVDRIVVDAGTDYDGAVQVLNETESPPENITEEVEEEAEAHQVLLPDARGIFTGYRCLRGQGIRLRDELGRRSSRGARINAFSVPESAQNGQLRVILSHFDETSPRDGVNQSDETDIDVTFQVEVRP